jgi:hypothetical protein
MLGVLMTGLILLIVGAVFLLKAKSKVVGLALIAIGMLFILVTSAIFLALIISTNSMG